MDVLELQRGRDDLKQAKLHHREKKRRDEYDALLLQVQALKDKNILPEEWTVPQLHLMLKWYKLPEDAAVPKRKGDMLAQYYEIRVRGEPRIPELLTSLPPPRAVPQSFLPALLPLLPTADSPSDQNSFTNENRDLSNDESQVQIVGIPDELSICCCGYQCKNEEEDAEADFHCSSCNLYAHEMCGSLINGRQAWTCITCLLRIRC